MGHEIIDSLWDHVKKTDEVDSYFHTTARGKPLVRSVNLDTEEKVVQACLAKTRNSGNSGWSYDPQCMKHEYGGAGNNWAMGHMCSDDFLQGSVNCLRRQLELCDMTSGLIITHSVGGGTGSGLGTRLTETIYDEFSDTQRINLAITPYHFGEVIVQHYNTLLCLSKISSTSDAVILYENEVARDMCKSKKGIAAPSLVDINSTIAENIVPLLLTKHDLGSFESTKIAKVKSSSLSISLTDDIIDLCAHPYYKFLSVYTVPQTSVNSIEFTYDSWSSLLNSTGRVQQQQAIAYEYHSSTNTPNKSDGATLQAGTEERNCPGVSSPATPRQRSPRSTPNSAGKYDSPSSGMAGAPSSSPSTSPAQQPKLSCVKSLLTFHGLDPQLAIPEILNKYYTSHSHYNASQRHHAQGRQSVMSPGSGATSTGDPYSYTTGLHVVHSIWSQYCNYSTWGKRNSHIQCRGSHHLANKYQRSASCISNNNACVPILQRSLDKATQLYRANAYVHHYYDYGLESGDFTEAIRSIAQTVHHYNDI